MKILALFMGALIMFQCYANEETMNYSFFSGKCWGFFVPYINTDENSNKKEYLAVVIYFQKDTLTIISADRTYKTKYIIENGIIKYHDRNGKYLINRHLFYNRRHNILYYKKPGFWYFIPKKIIYYPLQVNVAQKTIEEFQKNEYHKFQTNQGGTNP